MPHACQHSGHRKALGDDSANPKYIETAGKNGYRFIAPISLRLPQNTDGQASTAFVGRDASLKAAELPQAGKQRRSANRLCYRRARIGKDHTVDAFIAGLSASEPIVIARVSASSNTRRRSVHADPRRPGTIMSRAAGEDAIEALRRYATGLVNQPAGIGDASGARRAGAPDGGFNSERRLREITAFLSIFLNYNHRPSLGRSALARPLFSRVDLLSSARGANRLG